MKQLTNADWTTIRECVSGWYAQGGDKECMSILERMPSRPPRRDPLAVKKEAVVRAAVKLFSRDINKKPMDDYEVLLQDATDKLIAARRSSHANR